MVIELNKVTAINVPELTNHDFELADARPSTLENIRQINVIIGPNSSGKSRFIRTIFSNGITAFDLGQGLYKAAIDELNLSNPPFPSVYTAVNNLFSLPEKALLDSNLLSKVRSVIEKELLNTRRTVTQSDISDIIEQYFSTDFQNKMTDVSASVDFNMQSTRKEYIPILRGLRTLVATNDVYLERTLQDYFGGLVSGSTLNIFTGHTLYEDMVYALLGTEEEQESVKKYQDYLSIHFFEGQRVNIIPRKDRDDNKSSKENNVVHIKIGDEPQRPIYELGDGIQAMIALTVRPFLEKEPTIFFIEEPEQNLHAGMQRALIEAFRACPQHMFFFTTQSNHFVDLTLEADDLNLISVKKTVAQDGKATSIVQSQANNNEVLKDLGVLASSVLLANCSIWVEGITDKRYLQVYLAKYLDELETLSSSEDGTLAEREAAKARVAKLRTYNENLHYVFVEYQGSNITHWAFTDEADPEETSQTPAQKLSKDILLIADADIGSKGSRVKDLQEALGERFELLDWKEIENYLPHYVLLDTARVRWDTFNQRKNCSIDRFDRILINRFKDRVSGIGGILEYYVDKPPTLARKFYEADSGTIKDKVKFCDAAVELMNREDYEWQLSTELSDLCNKLWSFIEECN
ncbi:TPA: AAA family ATPase [Vibrio alginolyticus]